MSIPTWSIFALAASFQWSIVNLLDKIVLSHYRLTPWTYFALDSVLGILLAASVLVLTDNPLAIPKEAVILALLSGVAVAVFTILYFYALQISDVAVVVILIQSTPAFSLIWGLGLLEELYPSITYVGFLLVSLGVILAATSETKNSAPGQAVFTKAFLASLLMIAAAFSLSIGYFLQDTALQNAGVFSVFFWQRVCLVVLSLPVILLHKRELQQLSLAPVALTSLVELINVLALLAIMTAFSEGPLVVVTFLSSIQPVWILLFTWLLGSIAPGVLPRSRNISQSKLILACVLVLGGLYAINQGDFQ